MFSILRFRTQLLALALLSAAAPCAAGDLTVMLADGRTLEKVDLKPAGGKDEVRLERGSEPAVTVPVQELLVVDWGKFQGRPLTPTVRLVNGDQLYGKVSFPKPTEVRVAAGWGSVVVPLAWCSAIRLDEKAELPEPVSKDTVYLTGDRAEGEIQGVTAGKLSVKLGGATAAVDLSRIRSFALAPRPGVNPTPSAKDLLLAVDLGGGERLTGRWLAMTPDLLKLTMAWGDTLDVPLASLSRLEIRNGKLLYLSDLKPVETRFIPYLDGGAPGSHGSFRVDRSVAGRPLRLAGKAYARGLGVRSGSEITYTLDGAYQTFAATAGIDDAVGALGSVRFRVYGDDRLLFESPVLRGGDAPIDIKVEVRRVLQLRLEVEYADDGDAADHADWADARLLK